MQLRPDFTFERFVRTLGSAEAYRACIAVSEPGSSPGEVLVLVGPTGVGKTHLLHSIGHAVLARNPTARLNCVRTDEMVAGLVRALRQDRVGDFRSAFLKLDVLLVDDLHVLSGKPATQQEIASILCAGVTAGVRIACTGVGAVAEVAEFANRLISLSATRLVAVRHPTREGMRRILQAVATSSGYELPPGSLGWIAQRFTGDLRTAIGLLHQLRFRESQRLRARTSVEYQHAGQSAYAPVNGKGSVH